MKTRNGFVSNSSSTSFVVYLPKNFQLSDEDIDKAYEEYSADWNILNKYHEEQKHLLEDQWKALEKISINEVKKVLKRILKKLQEKGEILAWEDNRICYNILLDLLQKYVVYSTDSEGEEGCMGCISDKDLKKVRKNWEKK